MSATKIRSKQQMKSGVQSESLALEGGQDAAAGMRTHAYERLGSLAQALGSPERLRLIQILSQGPRSVEELSDSAEQGLANTSQHLQRLARDKIVTCRKVGVRRVYSIANEKVLVLWELIQELGHTLLPELNEAEEVINHLNLRSELGTSDVLDLVGKKKAVLLDVGGPVDSQSTPVPGAVSISFEGLKEQSAMLAKSKPIYIFCRGRYCSLASEAVEVLRAQGFKAFRLGESSFELNRLQKKSKKL
jgi:DNA-binding transcriptional ArsR family regulator/rhodanese-related sulfurtransferase